MRLRDRAGASIQFLREVTEMSYMLDKKHYPHQYERDGIYIDDSTLRLKVHTTNTSFSDSISMYILFSNELRVEAEKKVTKKSSASRKVVKLLRGV